ncbi:hypothetical protein C8R45DRAFT_945334 [Mycena sanguinolenta]|nr:hypothetical protein C8R45DRAFT_945334 [Mycena sanguinolenta]
MTMPTKGAPTTATKRASAADVNPCMSSMGHSRTVDSELRDQPQQHRRRRGYLRAACRRPTAVVQLREEAEVVWVDDVDCGAERRPAREQEMRGSVRSTSREALENTGGSVVAVGEATTRGHRGNDASCYLDDGCPLLIIVIEGKIPLLPPTPKPALVDRSQMKLPAPTAVFGAEARHAKDGRLVLRASLSSGYKPSMSRELEKRELAVRDATRMQGGARRIGAGQ